MKTNETSAGVEVTPEVLTSRVSKNDLLNAFLLGCAAAAGGYGMTKLGELGGWGLRKVLDFAGVPHYPAPTEEQKSAPTEEQKAA